MRKLLVLLGVICSVLVVFFFIYQDKLLPKKIEIDLDDSYIIYEEQQYNYEQEDVIITEYKFTKSRYIERWYWGKTPEKNEDYKEYALDQTTYLEAMNTLVNEMKFFTMEPDGDCSSFVTILKIKNGDLYREIQELDPKMWEQIEKLMNVIDPPM